MAPFLKKVAFEMLSNRLKEDGHVISPHNNPSSEVSFRASRDSKDIHISLYGTGTIGIVPGSPDCETRRDEILQKLNAQEAAIIQVASQDAYDFLEEIDRKYILASYALCDSPLELPEYCALVMPVAKAFEGFAKKVLVRLGVGNPAQIDDPGFFKQTFGGTPYNTYIAAHPGDKLVLERLQRELPFSRHGLMHSPPQLPFILTEKAMAKAKRDDILTLIRETAAHFKGRI